MKAIILCRVSTEEQKEAGNSLPAQKHRLLEYCKRMDFKVIKTFSFDESAYKVKRDEFDKAIEQIEASNEKLVICFDKVDRFTRNVFDKRVSQLYEMAMKDQVELHFVSDNLVINSNISASEKFHFGINLNLAKYYSDAVSDNVRRANEQMVRNGQWPGKAPLGYINIPDDNDGKNIIQDINTSQLIRKLFKLYGTGNESIKTLTAKMNKLGLKGYKGKAITTSIVHHILNNPFYYGEMKYKGILYPHRYDPLISRDLFQRCQQIIKSYNKKNFKIQAKPFIFRGLIKCKNCGCAVTPEIKKGKYIYYSCTNAKGTCKRAYVTEATLLQPVYEALKAIRMPDDRIKELTEALKKTAKNENAYHMKQMASLQAAYEKYENRLSNLLDEKVDGSITSEMYDKKVNEYKEEQGRILDQMQTHSNADHRFYLTANKVFNLAKRAAEIFESSEVQEKRALLNFLLQNCTLNGQKLAFDLREPFNLIVETKHHPIGLPTVGKKPT